MAKFSFIVVAVLSALVAAHASEVTPDMQRSANGVPSTKQASEAIPSVMKESESVSFVEEAPEIDASVRQVSRTSNRVIRVLGGCL